MLTKAFHAAFKPALENANKLPAAEAFQNCLKIIEEHGLVYEVKVTADQFLIHNKNRSNLMLNPSKSHHVGEQIHFAGADPKQLDAAFAFELAKEHARRAYQLKKNKDLIARSNDLVSPINGKERFITIGTSHFTQFVKQAMRGGKTIKNKLQDKLGNIDVSALKRNKPFADLLDHGWVWKIFVAELDEAYPDFATLAQRALNAFNSIRQDTGEIETAMQAGEFYRGAMNDGASDPKAAAIQAVSDGGSTIQGYVGVIFDYAQEYGGGEDLPWLCFVDQLSKYMGTSKPLGSAFWHSIYALKFWSDPKLKAKPSRPLMRLALLCTQSCMQSSKDGVADFLKELCLREASSKNMSTMVAEIDATLTDAFKIASSIDCAFLSKFVEPIGNLLIRSGLKVVDKESYAFDGKEKSVEQLRSLFLSELSTAHGQTVTFDPWNGSATCEPASVEPATVMTPASNFKSCQDFETIEGKAKEKGFVLGDFVYEKEFDSSAERLYTVMELNSTDRITLQKAFAYDGSQLERLNVSLETLISRWALKKEFKLPLVMSKTQLRPPAIELERIKSQAFEQLHKLDRAKCKKQDQGIDIWANPVQVRSGSHGIAAGQLTLVPFVPTVANITSKKTPAALQISSDPELYLVAPGKPQLREGRSELDQDQNCVAYWLINETHVQEQANMVESVIEKDIFSFPCLVNSKDIPPHTQLLVFKDAPIKETKRPLVGATIIPSISKKRMTSKQSGSSV